MRTRPIVVCLALGVLAAVLAARIDDALVLLGWAAPARLEIAADAESVMVRRRGVSSLELSLSRTGAGAAVSASALLERASDATWSSDPLAGMGAAAWNGPVRHQVLFRQGWPLDAFSASSTDGGGLEGGVVLGGPKAGRTIALRPVWLGLIGNTLVFASVLWLAVASTGAVRRMVRRRAGLCQYCAYSRRGLAGGAPCPECGRTQRA